MIDSQWHVVPGVMLMLMMKTMVVVTCYDGAHVDRLRIRDIFGIHYSYRGGLLVCCL